MKIGVMGSGAVGSFFGSFLSNNMHDVTYIARGAHLAEMKKNGLVIFKDNEETTIHGIFTNDISKLADCELVLFCVKSGDTKETAIKLKEVIKDSAHVISLQNGVSNEEILTDIFGVDRVISAVVFVQAAMKSPGMIEQSGRFGLVIGALSDGGKPVAKNLSTVFKNAQIPVKYMDDIMQRKWRKYLFSMLFNPLSAVTDKTIGHIIENPHLKEIAWTIGLETIQIAASCGVQLMEEDIEKAFENGKHAKDHITSMLQDIRNGKPTEADEMIGYLTNKSKIYNQPINAIETIYSLLKNKERELNDIQKTSIV
ncbi:ketopantoate reductase family protein [Neobacillus niacini]|uniref:ketopantoate reductase family protein n=1 Tax=Neobacillus niacini TaxID=86668 RepID=UPI003000F86C